jgi:hypothetical protein
MATAAVTLTGQEPLGLVVRDGGQPTHTPRIWMWYWANEEETEEVEGRER